MTFNSWYQSRVLWLYLVFSSNLSWTVPCCLTLIDFSVVSHDLDTQSSRYYFTGVNVLGGINAETLSSECDLRNMLSAELGSSWQFEGTNLLTQECNM